MGAKQAWLYVTILTVGYMISRGLAKSGSRDPYTRRQPLDPCPPGGGAAPPPGELSMGFAHDGEPRTGPP